MADRSNDPERWRRIEDLYHRALQLSQAEWPGFLRDACCGDESLQTEVAHLLAEQNTRTFLGRPAFGSGANADFCEPLIGKQIHVYKISALLGRGGMGEVYRAHDGRLGRDVAIKVLPPDTFNNSLARARLLREARTASRLNHPNVCTIYDVGDADNFAYIAMELVTGETLAERVEACALNQDIAVEYGIQLADALAHAHDRGVIHRDFKSANIIITPDGRAKVLDFGLAKPLERDASSNTLSLTAAGLLVGTLAYMAPESLRGERADERSDVWALGVVLYEMLTGVRPFRGRTHFELTSAILNQPPGPLSLKVSPELIAVVERCLDKQAARRYRNGREVNLALQTVRTRATSIPVFSRAARRIAVLPFQNSVGDPEQEYFVEGTHEALITDLAGITGLRVIARSSVMRFKGKEAALAEISKELKVDLLLTGSVMRFGDHVRIAAQLIDVASEEHVWASRYERPLVDILSLQNEIVSAIARSIELQLTPQEKVRLEQRRPVNAEAYEAYLKGRFQFCKLSREHYDSALNYFQLALEKDPNYVPAYAGIAATWLARGDSGIIPTTEAYWNSRSAIVKALELDDSVAEVHETLGNYKFCFEWDWQGAEAAFRRAIELNPNAADVHMYYSDFLISMRRTQEAAIEMCRALELDPLNSFLRCFSAWHQVYSQNFDQAIAELTNILRAEPNFSSARLGLWGAFFRKQMYSEALAEAKIFFAIIGDREIAEILGTAGESYSPAMKNAAQILADRTARTHVPAIRIARLYAHASAAD